MPDPLLQPTISMRTPYKVHLNFPDVFTVEAKVRAVRKAVINRCRQEISGVPPLQLLREEEQLLQQMVEAQQALQQLPEALQQVVLQQLRDREGPAGQELLAKLQPGHEPAAVQQHQQQQHIGVAAGSGDTASGATMPVAASNVATALQEATLLSPVSSSGSSTAEGVGGSSAPSTAAAAAAAAASTAPVDQHQQLDWESIIDFPHGSLRLLGSCKAPWMDSDPAWVAEKCYSEVQYVDGVWMRQPLSYTAVLKCSILLNAMELKVFEQSTDFLEAVYQVGDRGGRVGLPLQPHWCASLMPACDGGNKDKATMAR